MPRAPKPRLEKPAKVGHPEKRSKTPIEEFQRMSPEDQRKQLDRLPPAQRARLRQRLERFNQLPPEQQRTLSNLYNRLHQLPPERQESVRKAINKFSQQSPDRQQVIRDELRGMATLPEKERRERLTSHEFRSRFSHKEQEIVRDMSELLPPQE